MFERNRLFEGLPVEIMARAIAIPEVTSYTADEVIIEEGQVDDYVFLIGSGGVCISKRGRGGKQETLAHLDAGDFFGEMTAFDPFPRSARATAVHDVVLGRIDRAGLSQIIQLAPLQITQNLTRTSMRRLRDTDSHLIREMMLAERLSLIGSMASSIIHDLKNPIGVVRGVSYLLEGAPTEDDLRKWSGMLQRSADRMLEMVQEILDFARGTTVLSSKPVTTAEIVEEMDEQVFQAASRNGIRVEIQVEHISVHIDRARFVRALVNVAKNAVEAMPNGGVLVFAMDAGPAEVTFAVADTGPGIPEHLRSTLFEPFVTHGKSSGTGLGMAITKAVVDAHRGRISVSSEAGRGTRFEITIPREVPPEVDSEQGGHQR